MAGERRRQYGTGSVYRRASDGRWIGVLQAGWTERGTRRTVTVSAACPCPGTCRGPGKCPGEREARRKLDRRRHELDTGGAGATSRATVKTWATEWLTQHERKARPKYYATDASQVRRWIVPTIGHKRLDILTPGDVRAVATAIRDAGLSTTTARYAHTLLQRILRAAIVEGHQVPRRVLDVEPPRRAVHDRDAVPVDDARRLLEVAADRGEAARWAAAFLQGMRQAECLGLTWDAVDLTAGTLDVSWQLQALPYADRAADTFRVPDGYEARRLHGATHLVRPKTSRGLRIIPLVPWMTAALDQWRQAAPESPHGLVWADSASRRAGKALRPEDDRAAWYDLQSAAGVQHPAGRPYLLHEARHATATLLLEAGVSEAVVIAIMGHSAIATTRGYQHVSQALARRALDDVAGRLGLTAGP